MPAVYTSTGFFIYLCNYTKAVNITMRRLCTCYFLDFKVMCGRIVNRVMIFGHKNGV